MRPRLLGTTILTRDAPDVPGGTPATPPSAAPAPPPDPAAVAAGASPDPAATPQAAAPATPPATPPKTDWKDGRISELTAKYNETKRELDRLKAVPAAAPTPPVAKPGETQADFDARVAAEASRLAAESAWAAQCNEVAASGRKAFPDFDARLGAIKATINGQDEAEVVAYNSVLETAIETGKAHQLLYELGANPGEVRRLMNLSLTKRAMELAGMAAKIGVVAPPPDPSGAPAPITPIGSHGLHYEGIKADDPVNGTKLPIADWMAQREKQANERGLQ